MRLSIKETLLPQPPSFAKKKNYEFHSVLGTGTFGKVVHATWVPDPSQVVGGRNGSTSPFAPPSSVPDNIGKGDGFVLPNLEGNEKGIDVALKVIPKKRVKGNESVVWGEMEVLRGLDHPNIVRDFFTWRVFQGCKLLLRSNFTNGLNRGQNITYRSNSLPAENFSNALARKANLPRRMQYHV